MGGWLGGLHVRRYVPGAGEDETPFTTIQPEQECARGCVCLSVYLFLAFGAAKSALRLVVFVVVAAAAVATAVASSPCAAVIVVTVCSQVLGHNVRRTYLAHAQPRRGGCAGRLHYSAEKGSGCVVRDRVSDAGLPTPPRALIGKLFCTAQVSVCLNTYTYVRIRVRTRVCVSVARARARVY
jgi:hypothetical protein